jgi:transposase
MLRPTPIEPIPLETARVARAAFPKGNRSLRVDDEVDTLFTDELFTPLFPPLGNRLLHPGAWGY